MGYELDGVMNMQQGSRDVALLRSGRILAKYQQDGRGNPGANLSTRKVAFLLFFETLSLMEASVTLK